MQLLLHTNTINKSKYESLTRKYKDINLHDEAFMQDTNWKAIKREQETDTENIIG